MKKGFLPVFLLTAGILMSCGKKEDVMVEAPKAGYQQAYEEISRQCGQEDGGDLLRQ